MNGKMSFKLGVKFEAPFYIGRIILVTLYEMRFKRQNYKQSEEIDKRKERIFIDYDSNLILS